MGISPRTRDLIRRAHNDGLPMGALAAIVELRRYLQELEMETVETARARGATLEEIAEVLGISRQALHQRLRRRSGTAASRA